jgi:hypothetical protein
LCPGPLHALDSPLLDRQTLRLTVELVSDDLIPHSALQKRHLNHVQSASVYPACRCADSSELYTVNTLFIVISADMAEIYHVAGYYTGQFDREAYKNILDAKEFMNCESETDNVVVRYLKVLVCSFNDSYPAREVLIT